MAPVNETQELRKQRAILPHIGNIVTFFEMNTGQAAQVAPPVRGYMHVEVFEVTELFVRIGKRGQDGFSRSIPLSNVEVAWDAGRDCLELQVRSP